MSCPSSDEDFWSINSFMKHKSNYFSPLKPWISYLDTDNIWRAGAVLCCVPSALQGVCTVGYVHCGMSSSYNQSLWPWPPRGSWCCFSVLKRMTVAFVHFSWGDLYRQRFFILFWFTDYKSKRLCKRRHVRTIGDYMSRKRQQEVNKACDIITPS